MASDKKIQDYYQWYEKEYLKSIQIDKLRNYAEKQESDLKKRVNHAIDNFQFGISSIFRHEILNVMRFYVPVRKADYICTVFRISRPDVVQKIDYQTAYGFLYSHLEKDKLVHDYVCSTGTFRSADGEYRHRFITLRQFQQMYKKNANTVDNVETLLLQEAKKRKVHLYTESIFPDSQQYLQSKLEKEINEMRLAIKIWVICWIIDSHRFQTGKLENHLAKGYREAVVGENTELFTKWRNSHPEANIHDIQAHFSRFYKEENQLSNWLEVGQKFIPLTVHEIEEPNNITFRPWREMYITALVSDLVINGVTPCLPIFNDWFFIHGVRKSIYDNQINHLRMTHSSAASDIVKKLEAARRGTYIINPIDKKEVYLSFNMEGLAEAIEIPINYAEHDLIFSNYTLCSLNEHLGRTLGDLPRLVFDEKYTELFGPIFRDFRTFAFYMYEYVYTFYTLNKYRKLIHGDAHLNNTTFFAKLPPSAEALKQHPSAVFQVEDEFYVFPFYGRHVGIIDFSRGILETSQLREDFAENEVMGILHQQRQRVAQVLQRDFPDFFKSHEEKIQLALLENFDLFFKVLTVIDIHKVCMGWLYTFDVIAQSKKDTSAFIDPQVLQGKIIPFVKKIRNMAFHLLTSNLLKIFQRQITKASDVENPNLHIIRSCFGEFNLLNWQEDFVLSDFFSAENDLVYNIRQYDHFPETVKFDYIIKHKLKMEEIGLHNYHEHKKYLVAHPPEKDIEAISAEVQAERDERRGIPEELRGEHKPTTKEISEYKTQAQSVSSEYFYET